MSKQATKRDHRVADDAGADRALHAAAPKARTEHPKLSLREKRDILLRLRDSLERMKANPRGWIARLKERVRSGQPLSAAQQHALGQVRGAPVRAPFEEDFYA